MAPATKKLPQPKRTKVVQVQPENTEEVERKLIVDALQLAPKQGEKLNEVTAEPTLQTEEWVLPVEIDTQEGSSYIVVYHVASGEPRVIHTNYLRTTIQKVDPDTGKPAFSLSKPDKVPFRGKIKCLLHPDDDRRAEYDAMGLPVCRKSNIPNQYNLNLHMARKHKSAYAAIEEERKARELAEEREFRRLLLAKSQS